MEPLSFDVPGAPVPKARARVMAAGYSFTPKRVREYEASVRAAAAEAVAQRPDWPKEHPGGYKVRVAVYRARAAGDLDNFAKSALDAMNKGVVFDDDRRVVELHALLLLDRERPHLLVEVEPL